MKTLNLSKHGLAKVMLTTFCILTLGTGLMWADNAGLNKVDLTYSCNGTSTTKTCNASDNGTAAVDLGTLTADFKITGIKFYVWKNENDWGKYGNICGGKAGSDKFSDWEPSLTWSSGSWNGSSHDYTLTGTSLDKTVVTYNSGESGSYSATMWFWATGDKDDNSNCGDNFYVSNGGSNYTFNYKIAPPAVNDFSVSTTGSSTIMAGSGTSSDPYIISYNGSLKLTLTGSEARTDENSSLQYNTSSTWDTTTSRTISNITSTTVASVTVKMRCYNSTASLSGTESSQTIYYKAENRYTAYVQTYTNGSATPTSSSTYMGQLSGGAITATPNTGYTFNGWTLNSGTGSFADKSAASTTYYPTSNSQLKANFVAKTYTVKLDKNGGTSDGSVVTTYNKNTTSDFTGASRAGYSTDGYYTDPSTGSKIIDADGNLVSGTVSGWLSSGYWVKDAATITLYPHWTEDVTYYTLNFGVRSGQSSYGSVTAKNSSTNAALTNGSTYISGTGVTVTAAPGDDYKLTGWYNAASGGSAISSAGTNLSVSFSLNANTKYYAAFAQKSTTITLNNTANGGSGGTTSKTINHGASMSGLTAPGKSGYTFTGWWTSDSGGSKVIDTDGTLVASVTVGGVAYTTSGKKWDYDDDALILYAQYTENMTTVTINVSPTGAGTLTVGGSAFTAGNTTTAGKTTSRTVVATAGSDYVFNNWTVSGEATGTASTNTYTLKGSGNGSTGTLTANFTAKTKVRLYFKNTGNWSTVKAYVWYYSDDSDKNAAWSGVAITSNTETIDCQTYYYYEYYKEDHPNWNRIIFNDGGSNKTADITFSNSTSNNKYVTKDNTTWAAITSGSSYSVTVASNNTSYGTVSPASGTASTGCSLNITATAKTNYVLDNWSATDGITIADNTATSTSVTATKAGTVTANFCPVWNIRGIKSDGTANYWDTPYLGLVYKTTNTWEATVSLTANTTYEFKVFNRSTGEWFGKDGTTLTRNSNSVTVSSGNNINLTTDLAGTYTFTYNSSSNTITITYPTAYAVTYDRRPTAAANAVTVSPSFTSGSVVASNTFVTFTRQDAKTGYTWKGWYTNENGTGTALGTGDTYPQSIAATFTIYAVYTEKEYDVTVSAGAHGSVTPSGTVSVPQITGKSITASPADGFKFSKWTITGSVTPASSTTNPQTFKATAADGTITAEFVQKPCTLQYGSATPLNSPSTKVMTYDADNDYYYTDVTTNSSPYYFRFLFDGTDEYGGAWNTYPDVLEVVPNGAKVACSTLVTSWENKSSVKFTGLNSSVIRIYFDYQHKQTWITETLYDVTINDGDYGTVSPNGLQHVGRSGMTITATPVNGYAFKSWTRTDGATVVSSTSNPTQVKATAAGTVTATYQEDWFVCGSTTKMGSWAEAWSTGKLTQDGSDVSVTLTLDAGTTYEFKMYKRSGDNHYWSKASTSITGTTSNISLDSNSSLANMSLTTTSAGSYEFKLVDANSATPKLTVTYPDAATVTYSATTINGANDGYFSAPTAKTAANVAVASGSYVVKGTSVTFTASAAKSGYTFNGWYTAATGGTQLSSTTTYTATINASTTVYARYTQNTYSVTLTNSNATAGTINTSSPVTVGQAEAVQIQATANYGYNFNGWTKTGSGTVTYWTAAGTSGSTDATGASKTTTYIKTTGTATLQANWVEDLTSTYVLKGSFDSWGSGVTMAKKTGHSAEYWVYCTKDFTAGTSAILLKLLDNGITWYGAQNAENSLTKQDGLLTSAEWTLTNESGGQDINFYPSVTGTYEFAYNISTQKLIVTYPNISQLQLYSSYPANDSKVGNYDWTISGNLATKTLTLPASTYYAFKCVYNSDFYGNTGTMNTQNHTGWTMSKSDGDCGINTSVAGDYLFTFNTSTKVLSVTYPPEVALAADPASVYSGSATTLTASTWNIETGKSLKYEFFNGATATGTAIATKTVNTSGTEHSTTQSVTPSFGASETYKDYTVKITYNGVTSTSTVRVYRKWDIYVHDVADWGGMYAYYYNTSGGVEYTAWPGTTCSNYEDNATWYTIPIDAKYDKIQLNCNNCTGSKRTDGNDAAYDNDLTTFPIGSYWYTNFKNNGDDGFGNACEYYQLVQITPVLPTVVLRYVRTTENQIRLTGYMENCGNDGTNAAEMKEVAFLIDGTKYVATCTRGGSFFYTKTGLTANTNHTVKAIASNIIGQAESAQQTVTTTEHTTNTINIQIPLGNTAPTVYAYTPGDSCGNNLIENAAWSGVATTKELDASAFSWYSYELPIQYDSLIISADGSSEAVRLVNPYEEICYWYNQDNAADNRVGTMVCPPLVPSLMIETTAGGGEYV
ncbi:MAG: starch-binding protein [Paludibacteraceae bacterium]|nr:starch-binding protein [Paludibacteraceae bacterium]